MIHVTVDLILRLQEIHAECTDFANVPLFRDKQSYVLSYDSKCQVPLKQSCDDVIHLLVNRLMFVEVIVSAILKNAISRDILEGP